MGLRVLNSLFILETMEINIRELKFCPLRDKDQIKNYYF